ncbi:MAG: amino acid adenylation domain-containing protein [Cyanobacteria bacterium P01_F01_bin.4]
MSHSPSASQQLSPEEKRALVAKLLQQKAQTEDCTYRLSYGQRALWFLYQSNRDSHAYNLSIPARIKSPVDIAALKQAFQGLVDRHPTLRTTFTTQADGDPVQVVHGTLPVYFELIDATKWSQDQLNQCVLDTHRRPFDLENGPVFKVVLFTLNPQEHILLLSLHHITYDAWSHGPFLQDAQALYVAAKAGTVASLPPLQKQYSDYVQWQIETLMGPEGERLWSYWQTQLGGDLSTLNLPTDRPRPLHPSYKGDTYLFKLTPAQTQAIKQLAQAEGTTLYIVLMAVFQILLYRYTGQSDILVGSPIGDRPQAEFEPVLGYFVNPVAIRGRLADTLSCQDFLGQIRTTVLDAIDHQNYPFPLLVERLQPDRDPSRSPIFQVLFNFLKLQPTEVAATLLMPGDAPSRVQWADLELESFQLEQQEGQFDVTLEMIETPDDLIGVFKYSTDLFNVDTIERMAGHFQTLLTGIAANPQQSIDTLPLLSAVERHQLLSEWNNTQTNFSQNHHHPCIHQLFEAQIDRTPHDIAVVFESEQITYQDLNTRANQLAHYLRSLGVGPEVRVGICIERSIDMVVGVLGILKAGGAYVPLDPAYPQERLAFMAEDAQMAVLLTQTHLRASLPNLQSVCLDRDWQTISAVNEGLYPPDSQVTSDHLAYIIYTSGSTGQPKGVQIPHRNAVNLLASVQTQPGLTASDTLLAVATLSFDISVAEVFLPLMVGAKLVIASREVAADGFQLLQAMETHQPTFMQPTPATWRMLLAAGWTGSPYLKMISTAEPLPRDLVTQLLPLGKELWNLYGPTETTIWSAGYQVMTDDQPITIGYPIANTQLYILDSHMQPLPIGIPGELYIGGGGTRPGLSQSARTDGRQVYC